LGQMMSF